MRARIISNLPDHWHYRQEILHINTAESAWVAESITQADSAQIEVANRV